MTFSELKQEDFAYRQYEYLKSFLAVHDQVPIRIITIENQKKTKVLVIKQATTGIRAITTRQFDIPREDGIMFLSWIANDFPNVEFENISG